MSYNQGTSHLQEDATSASDGTVFPPGQSVAGPQAAQGISSKRTSQSSDQVDPMHTTAAVGTPGYHLNNEPPASLRYTSVSRPVPISPRKGRDTYINPNESVWLGPMGPRRPKPAQSKDPQLSSQVPSGQIRAMSPARGARKPLGRSPTTDFPFSSQHIHPGSPQAAPVNGAVQARGQSTRHRSVTPAQPLPSPPGEPPSIPLPEIPTSTARKLSKDGSRHGSVEALDIVPKSNRQQQWFVVELVQGEKDESVYLDREKGSSPSSFPAFLHTEVIHDKSSTELQMMIVEHLQDKDIYGDALSKACNIQVIRIEVVWENSLLTPTIWNAKTHTGIKACMKTRKVDGLRVKVDVQPAPPGKRSSADNESLYASPRVEAVSVSMLPSGETEPGKTGMFGTREGLNRIIAGKGDDGSESIKDGKTSTSRRYSDGRDRIIRGVFGDPKGNMM